MRRAAWLAGAALLAASCAEAPAACEARLGGETGAVAQLRWVRFGDDQISLLFGLTSGTRFGIPEHVVETTGEEIRISIPESRLRYPDGTPSYLGEEVLHAPGGGAIEVDVAPAGDGTRVRLRSAKRACPRVASRRYGLGSTHSAALISIALRDGPSVALDPAHGAPGFPMQVVGLGFGRSERVSLSVDGRGVWESTTDAAGQLDTVLYVPDLPPGERSVVVKGGGGSATAWFRVDAPESPR